MFDCCYCVLSLYTLFVLMLFMFLMLFRAAGGSVQIAVARRREAHPWLARENTQWNENVLRLTSDRSHAGLEEY